MPISTVHLLPWSRPLLPQAVAWLASEWRGGAPLDLTGTLVVVPTRQSGRRLREALAKHAAARQQAVFPPVVALPEQLIRPAAGIGTHPVASPHEALFAWAEVVAAIDLAEFDEVFPVAPPSRSFAWAARLAREFLRLQSTLAEEGLRMADVPARAGGPFPESRRWGQLAALERRYDQLLAQRERIDPQAARIAHARSAPAPADITRIVIVGTPDPLPLALEFLARCAGSVSVEVLVFGPEDADVTANFDALGRPQIDAWATRPLPLTDFNSQVHLCADPADQAARVVKCAHAAGRAEGLLAIGVADPEIIAPLTNGFRRAGIAAFDPEGRPNRATALFRLLQSLAALAREPSFAAIESLARCPDLLAWLEGTLGDGFSSARFLASLDKLHRNHLPATLEQAREHGASAALDAIAGLRTTLTSRSFAEGARTALQQIYGNRQFSLDKPADAAAVESARAWIDILDAVAEAALRFKSATHADLWEVALAAFGETARFEEKPAGALELLGWLELFWEDAPQLILAGLNDGRVPTAISGDAFLPESLRERLGLKTNAARLARDAYLLHAIAACRTQHGRIDILLGRVSAAREPLRPSRLLLACPDAQLADRIAFLFHEISIDEANIPWRRAWKLRPQTPKPITRMSATGFSAYLECPFRFYLSRGLRMEAIDPRKSELDERDFGTLCHDALEAMGRDTTIRASPDAKAVSAFLHDALDRIARAKFGATPPLPLRVQLESARQRLTHVARIHAEERAKGWLITDVEQPFELTIGGMLIRGKVDRIDVHETTGACRILDYKTSDVAKAAAEAHFRKVGGNEDPATLPDYLLVDTVDGPRAWKNLQLPLYRLALRAEHGDAITCGYINMPRAVGDTQLALWENYPPAYDDAAERCATGIVKAVAAGVFWPPGEVKRRTDEFAPLIHESLEASIDWPGAAQEVTP